MKTHSRRLATTKRMYEEYAVLYAEKTSNEELVKRKSEIPQLREQFLSYLPKKGKTLDVGYGSGRDSIFFESQGCDVTGVDISEVFIKKLQKISSGNYIVGDIVNESLPIYKSDYYDGIWCCASLVHLNRKESFQVIKNVYFSLKPGGILFIGAKVTKGKTGFFRALSTSLGGVKRMQLFYNTKDLEHDCKTAGFTIIDTSFGPGSVDMMMNIFARK